MLQQTQHAALQYLFCDEKLQKIVNIMLQFLIVSDIWVLEVRGHSFMHYNC